MGPPENGKVNMNGDYSHLNYSFSTKRGEEGKIFRSFVQSLAADAGIHAFTKNCNGKELYIPFDKF